MAISPYSNEAFLREVDDELRRDEMASAWKRYGLWIVAAIVLGLAAFGGYLFWQHHSREAAGREGEELQGAFDKLSADQRKAAEPALATLAGSRVEGYRALALFSQADILLQNNDYKGAAAKFATVVADGAQPQPLRDLALIRQTAAEYDGLKPQVVIERLRPLVVAGNPWFGSAGEMTAAAHLAMGRRDLAANLFRQIGNDSGVPDGMRQRAVQMAGALASAAPATNSTATRDTDAR